LSKEKNKPKTVTNISNRKEDKMSVIMMCTTKVMTGKMAEYMALEKKMGDVMKDVEGAPPPKRLMLVSVYQLGRYIITTGVCPNP